MRRGPSLPNFSFDCIIATPPSKTMAGFQQIDRRNPTAMVVLRRQKGRGDPTAGRHVSSASSWGLRRKLAAKPPESSSFPTRIQQGWRARGAKARCRAEQGRTTEPSARRRCAGAGDAAQGHQACIRTQGARVRGRGLLMRARPDASEVRQTSFIRLRPRQALLRTRLRQDTCRRYPLRRIRSRP